MSIEGYREIIFTLHELGFKGGLTAPATRKRGRDFVDWLAISTAHDMGIVGAVTLHVNLGVRWTPLHKMHKAALGETRMQPECFEPLYVLMPHRDVMRWRLAADDSNLQSVTEDLVDAINSQAEEYWRSVSRVSRVCQDLQRQSINNDFPSGLDWPLAVMLTEGRERALRAVEAQREQLATEKRSPWLTQTHEFLEKIESYIKRSERGGPVISDPTDVDAVKYQYDIAAEDKTLKQEELPNSQALAAVVKRLQGAREPHAVGVAVNELEDSAVDGKRLLPPAPEIVRLLATGLSSATPAGVASSWRVLTVIAKASRHSVITGSQILLPVREVLVADVVPGALELVSGHEEGEHVWHAVDLLLNVLVYTEDDPAPFRRALRKFSKRGPAEARHLSDIFPR